MSLKKANAVNIDKEIFNHGLSLGAIGLYVFLSSLPENEVIIKPSVLKSLHSIGREKFDRLWRELGDNLLIEKTQHKTTKGRFSGTSWKVNKPRTP